MTDFNQALAFFQALTGEASPVMTWQAFCDPDLPADWVDSSGKAIDYLAEHWRSHFDAACVERLNAKQRAGAGVFFSVNNATNGGRKAADIDQYRAMVVDSDGVPYPAYWPYPPHAIIARDDTHWHAYWFIDGVGCDRDSWSFSQYQLALWFGGDLRMINPDRVLRVPGFLHQKDLQNPHRYNIVHFAPTDQRYNMTQLMSGFVLDGERAAKLAEWVQSRSGRGDINMVDYNDSDINVAKYLDYLLTRAEHGIDGQGRNGIRFKTAAAGRDYGLSPEMVISMMLEHWDHGNTPPCGPALIETSVRNAYRYSQNNLGARSLSVWLDQPFYLPPGASAVEVNTIHYEIPAPEKKPKIDKTKGDEICFHGAGYNKNHTNNAQMFIRQFSPNGELFVFNEEMFRYNGKVYDKIEAVLVEKMMHDAIEHTMPSSADLSGSMKILKVKLAESVEKMPAWRNQKDRSVSGVIAFSNGIVDLEANTFEAHTEDLLTCNMLEYEYDPQAQCPNWLGFLNDLWGHDPDLIRCFRQWMGYCMVHDYSHQKIATLIGKPRSGKGTIARVAHSLIGKFNCASPSLANLANAEVLHAMSGKLLATIPDASSVSGPNAAAVMEHLKSISGNDSVTFNRKYLSASTETISARLMIIANEFPHFNDPSGAIVDRILYFPFRVSHAGREDPGLTKRLLSELPGIAIWAIGGLIDLRQSGRFVEPESTRRVKNQLRRQLSPALSFFSEAMRHETNGFVNDNAMYQRYVGWCKSTGTFAASRDSLIRAMESAIEGIWRDTDGGLTGFRGAVFANNNGAPSAAPSVGQLA